MTLVAEDGTGKPDAESYNTLAEVASLLADRGLTLPAGVTGDNEAAARQATSYIDGHYDFVGVVQYTTQALAWPRSYAYDHEGRRIPESTVPPQVKRAHAFLTYQARLGDLEVVEEGTGGSSGAGGTKSTRIEVGPIVKAEEFFQATSTSAAASQKKFTEVDTLLGGLLAGKRGGVSGTVLRWS